MTESSESPSQGESVPTASDAAQPIELSENPEGSSALSAYFGERKMSAASFVKAVRAARISRFDENDRLQALSLMEQHDIDGERLWKLLSEVRLPECVSTWIWKATRERLSLVFGLSFDIENQTPAQLQEMIRQPLARLSSGGKKQQQPVFWARIASSYLLQARGLGPLDVFELLGAQVYESGPRASQYASTAIHNGSNKEVNLGAAVATLSRRALRERERERDDARTEVVKLRQDLEVGEAHCRELDARIRSLEEQNMQLSASLNSLSTKLDTERQHWGYDLTEIKAGKRILLRDKVLPLVSDAIDALEIESPVPPIALGRLRKVVSIIEEASM